MLDAAHNEIREKRVEKTISEAPESVQNTLRQAFSGSASPRKAIKAMCLACVGYDRKEVTNCSSFACPLWKYRPFQLAGKDDPLVKSALDTINTPEAQRKIHGGNG